MHSITCLRAVLCSVQPVADSEKACKRCTERGMARAKRMEHAGRSGKVRETGESPYRLLLRLWWLGERSTEILFLRYIATC